HAVPRCPVCRAAAVRAAGRQPADRGADHRVRDGGAPGVLVQHLHDDLRPLPAPRGRHGRRNGRRGRRTGRHPDRAGDRVDARADRLVLADPDLRGARLPDRLHRHPPAGAADGAGTRRPAGMSRPLRLHPDRLFPAEPRTREIARSLYAGGKDLPIVSPHGHTDPAWFATNEPFADPASLLIVPDHYLFRMLYSQGVRLEDLGIPTRDGTPVETDPRAIWRRFAAHYHLFRGTPSRMWLDWVFAEVFG